MNQTAVSTSTTSFTCPGALSYIKDTEQIIVVDESRGKVFFLCGLEAAVWDWLMLAYPYSKLVRMVAEFSALPAPKAEQQLHAILKDWCANGLMEESRACNG